jgi:hypothetical protein
VADGRDQAEDGYNVVGETVDGVGAAPLGDRKDLPQEEELQRESTEGRGEAKNLK